MLGSNLLFVVFSEDLVFHIAYLLITGFCQHFFQVKFWRPAGASTRFGRIHTSLRRIFFASWVAERSSSGLLTGGSFVTGAAAFRPDSTRKTVKRSPRTAQTSDARTFSRPVGSIVAAVERSRTRPVLAELL